MEVAKKIYQEKFDIRVVTQLERVPANLTVTNDFTYNC